MKLVTLTLNCWGLPFNLAKDKDIRIQFIADRLASGDYHIVALQEVWMAKDYDLIKSAVRAVLPYSFYFYRGFTSTGLCVFSKWPITDTLTHIFSLNGYAHELTQLDWYGSKMAALCRIDLEGLKLNVYNTHAHALYAPSDKPNEDRVCSHRLAQLYELSEFVRQTSDTADLVLVLGDLNTEPSSLGAKLILVNAGLSDAWYMRENTEYLDNKTIERPDNKYAMAQTIYYMNTIDGERIDYVMYRHSTNKISAVKCLETTLDLQRARETDFHYSDHEGVCSKLEIVQCKDTSGGGDINHCNESKPLNDDLDAYLLDAINILQDAQVNVKKSQVTAVIKAILCFLLLLCSVFVNGIYPALTFIWTCGLTILAAFYVCLAVVVKCGEAHALEGIIRSMVLRRSHIKSSY